MTSPDSARRQRAAMAPPTAWVLVVDDSKEVRDAVSDYLQVGGHQVKAVEGAQALRLLEESLFPPRVVVLDWLMPDVSGLEILHYVRTDPRMESTKVVVLTGLGARTAKEDELVSWGALRVLRKPIAGKELLAAVNEALRVTPADAP